MEKQAKNEKIITYLQNLPSFPRIKIEHYIKQRLRKQKERRSNTFIQGKNEENRGEATFKG